MNAMDAIFYVAILIMSVVIHEISHGFMALYFGDKTAQFAGRLTLNPIKHLDILGSIIVPALLYFSSHGSFVVGWAKPVPYNPNNLTNKKWGEIAVASAGVLANLFIAVFFGLILRFTANANTPEGLPHILFLIVVTNLGLAIFNLVPIPPLDGSKILFNLLPYSMRNFTEMMERYSLIFLVVFILFLSNYLYPVLKFLFHIITGLQI